jgi:ribosomal protein S18 acetylase RimI-like enzyme
MPTPRQGLRALPRLNAQTRREVEALVALCKQHEPIDLPLLLESVPPSEDDENLYFLYYRDDVLLGAASTWPGPEIEAVGAVHPAYRRQGIGSALLNALRQEGRGRGAKSLLLICEEASPAGQAFARAVGAHLEFAEYRLELERATYAPCPTPPQALKLRRAGAADQDTLIALLSTFDRLDTSAARRRIQEWLNTPNQRLYIGWLQDRTAGMIRLHQGESSVYLYSFLVHPDLRGRGYGRQILTGILDALIAEDWPHIMIEVDTTNAVALSLYRSCGFCEVAAYQYHRLTIESL